MASSSNSSTKPLTSPEFDAALASLNPEQREAVEAIDGPVFVIAGPGTGKTQVLTLRIANILLKTDTPPEAILALTFTESGADEMRQRLARFIGSRAAKVRFHTFHGFAQTLVNHFPEHFTRILGSQIASDAEHAEIIEEAILKAEVEYLRPVSRPMANHYSISRAIQTLKRENVTVAILAERVAEEEKKFEAIPDKESMRSKNAGTLQGKYITLQKKIAKTRDLLNIYTLYEELLPKHNRYDYEDLILEAVRALSKDDSFRTEVQEGFLYILADEHQDANRSQNTILEQLVEYTDNPNLFIVGDEKQAIYRFQGADLDNVQYFRDRFQNTKVIVLKENYRSTQTILDTSLSLIMASKDTRLSRLPLSAQQKESNEAKGLNVLSQPITLAACATPEDEADFLAEKIQELVASGAHYEDIAVLVRTNNVLLELANRLTMRDIPVTTGTEDALHNRFVAALLRLLTYVADPRDENVAGVLMLPGFLFSPADVSRLTRHALVLHMSVYEILEKDVRMKDAGLSDEGREIGKKFFDAIKELSHEASIERPAIVAKDAFKVSGLLDIILAASDRSEGLAAIRAFLTLAEELSMREHEALLPRLLGIVSLYKERTILLPAAPQENLGSVKLMTVHKAKGREFPYVFMPVLTNRVWDKSSREDFIVPGVLSNLEETEDDQRVSEDERRLLYVGMTRAKKHVTISYAASREDGKSELPFELLEDLSPALVENIIFENKIAVSDSAPDRAAGSVADSAELAFLREGKKKNYNGILEPTKDDFVALNAALFAQGLSPTALNNYLSCPWKYFYQNLLRIPSAEKGYLLFGTAMHYALEQYAYRRSRGEQPGLEYLMDRFEQKLMRSPLTETEIVALRKKGKEALPLWLAQNEYRWPERSESEVKLTIALTVSSTGSRVVAKDNAKEAFENEPETIPLTGKLDRVDDVGGNNVRVIDYKTGEQHSRNHIMGKTADSKGDIYRQLTFYKLLLTQSDPARTMTEGVIEFVEPHEKGELRTEAFEIPDAEVSELEELIRKCVEEIRTLSFWTSACDDEKCEWCPIRFGLAEQKR